MKRNIYFLAAAILATVALAGDLGKVVLNVNNINTSATNKQDFSASIKGWIERIDYNFRTNTITNTFSLISSNAFTGKSATLLSVGAVSTGDCVYPRFNADDTGGAVAFTNNAQRFIVLDEVIYLRANQAAATNQNITATIIYERP